MSPQHTRISKFISLVLRHQPEKAGLSLDSTGWVAVDDLLRGCNAAGVAITRADLELVVSQNDKRRFAFSPDGLRIRANQGHSVADVEVELTHAVPPATLFHGTADRFLTSIMKDGLLKGRRHHVHLSADHAVAIEVGRRHGRPVVLTVDATAMHAAGHAFFRSANGVWLTEHVPAKFLSPATATPAR